MATDYVTSTAGLPLATDQPKSAATKAGDALASDYNNFLLLLTTQLKNQDPTQPMDTNQMTQQLATFASVEQQVATNKNMEKLVSLYAGSTMDNLVGYIGKNVEAEGGYAELANKQAYFSYQAPEGANQVLLSVVDANNKVVFSVDGDTASGRHALVWNGANSYTGATQGDGVYKLVVTALDRTGTAITEGVKAYTNGKVTAVESTGAGSEAVLKLGNISLPISSVTTVRETPVATTPTPTPETGSNSSDEAA